MGDHSVQWDFFIAHAGADSAAAVTLYQLLAPVARVFLDSMSLQPGDEWDRVLPLAQRQSRVTVVLVSSRSEATYYQREEIAAAIAMSRDTERAHRVVPVFLDSSAATNPGLPYGLRLRHAIYVSHHSELPDVVNRLNALLSHPQPSRTSPVPAMVPTDIKTLRHWAPLAGQLRSRSFGSLRSTLSNTFAKRHSSLLSSASMLMA